jgi:hypothetical protein
MAILQRLRPRPQQSKAAATQALDLVARAFSSSKYAKPGALWVGEFDRNVVCGSVVLSAREGGWWINQPPPPPSFSHPTPPHTVELRSDTFTKPCEGMRKAMYNADVSSKCLLGELLAACVFAPQRQSAWTFRGAIDRSTSSSTSTHARTQVGDSMYGEDKTVQRLEEAVAGLLGKEAGLFGASGACLSVCLRRASSPPPVSHHVESFF